MTASALLSSLINDAHRNGKPDVFAALKLLRDPVAALEPQSSDYFCQWCYDRGLRYSRPGPWGHSKECPNRKQDAEASPDPNVEAVRAQLLERSKVGLRKYGVTTEHAGLSRVQWLRHAQQEALDFAVYLEVLIQEEERRADLAKRFRAMLDADFCGLLNEAQRDHFERWITRGGDA